MIKEIRQRHNISVNQLSKITGLSRVTLHNMENGGKVQSRSIAKAKKGLAKILNEMLKLC